MNPGRWQTKPAGFAYALILAALLGRFVLLSLISDGMEVVPDSVKYINDAVNLVNGYGISLRCPPNVVPDTHWAPGYSVALAVPVALGFQWLEAAESTGLLCYVFLLLGVFAVTLKTTASLSLALLSEAAIGLHPVILRWAGSVLSEPLSWVFAVVIAGLLNALVLRPRMKLAVLLGTVLGCAMLVRYAFLGFALGSSLAYFLLIKRTSFRRGAVIVATYLSVSGVILGLWLLRNWTLTGRWASGGSGRGWLERNMFYAMVQWWEVTGVFAKAPGGYLAVLIVALLLGFAAVAALQYKELARNPRPASEPAVGYLVSFLLAGSFTLTMAILRTIADPITLDSRMFSPVAPLFIIMIMAMAASASAKLKPNFRWTGAGRLGTVPCLLLVIVIAAQGLLSWSGLKGRSKGYYDWRSSPTMEYVARQFEPDSVVTTDWEPFWLWYGFCPESLPRVSPVALAASSLSGVQAMVWFKETHRGRGYLVQPDEMVWDVEFSKVEFPDGIVYARLR